jgi:2-polyprenyl-3-methyl-5-hydroxy-6-metoxy-1,4-benzoquinol methylase
MSKCRPNPQSPWGALCGLVEPYFRGADRHRVPSPVTWTPSGSAPSSRAAARSSPSLFRAIELQLSPYFNPSAILEYGCGAGRLAIPLARALPRNAGSVTAVDRSHGHARCRRGARPSVHGVSNVGSARRGSLRRRPETFDFITCLLRLAAAAAR